MQRVDVYFVLNHPNQVTIVPRISSLANLHERVFIRIYSKVNYHYRKMHRAYPYMIALKDISILNDRQLFYVCLYNVYFAFILHRINNIGALALYLCRRVRYVEVMRANIVSILLVACWLSGCHINTAQVDFQPFNETPFEGYQQVRIETSDNIFALSPEARKFVDEVTEPHSSAKQKMHALVDAIFSRTKLDLRYSATANTIASQTFQRRFANCLSLTIMTYAMVDYMGFDAVFQDVQIPEYWTIREGQTFVNSHINLRVKLNRTQSVTIDFDPYPELSGTKVKDMSRQQLVASFYSNVAAEYLLQKDNTRAFAYLKEAIQVFPHDAGIWLNLGTAYSRAGMPQSAIGAYETALELTPDFNTAFDNLAILYDRLGESDKADEIQSRLHSKRIKNPFYHMMLAEHALEETKPEEAILHYKKALRLDRAPHEFHFGLAKAYSLLGDYRSAEKALKTAIKRAEGKHVTKKYNKKLSLLASS